MQTGSAKRLIAIVAGFLVVLFLLMKLSPGPKSTHRKHTASKPVPVAAETGKTAALTPKLAPPAGAVPPALAEKPEQAKQLSGPPRHDIFVRIVPKSKQSAAASKPAAKPAKNKVNTASQAVAAKVAPPPLKLLGTVIADGSAAAVVSVGQRKLYVEPGQSIPYGEKQLVVAQISPEQVRCQVGDSVRLLQLAKF